MLRESSPSRWAFPLARHEGPGIGARLVLALIAVYRVFVSPLLGPHCRFMPSCSVYTATAIRRYGLLRGCWLGACRIARCHPFHPGGDDPVK